jgi:peptidoglycan-associated lipoprotein
MHKSLLIAGTAGLTLLLAACSSTPTGGEQSPAPVEERGGQAVEPGQVKPVTPEEPSGSPLAALRDPNSPLSKRSIYFDYDSFVVKDEFRSLIENHARFLSANPGVKMLIQGNADERGSREYNLALGQKRADAVKKALVLLGAKDAQIESVSLGEEKPKNAGHDESAYAENRRGDMLYSGEF